MAKFAGDVANGKALKANSILENFFYDLTFQEDKCVWKHREQLEQYFLILSVVFCWTVIIPIIKLAAYFKSRGRSDHRKN
jgi:hypothetical protein